MHSATCSLPNDTSCAFTYTGAYNGSTLTSANKETFTDYEDIILTGDFGSANYDVVFKNIFTGKETVATSTSTVSNTQIAVLFPPVEEGMYKITLRTDEGDSEGVSVELKMSIVESSINMTTYGGRMRIQGVGLPEKWPHPLFSANRKWEILESTPTHMIVEVPHRNQEKTTTFKLKGILSTDQLTVYQKYSCNYNATVTVTSASNTYDFVVGLQNSNGNYSAVRLISKTNSDVVDEVGSFSHSGNQLTFSRNILPGAYYLRVHSDGPSCVGWMQAEDLVEISAGSLTYNLKEVGTEGSMFAVEGAVGEGSFLRVDGQRG